MRNYIESCERILKFGKFTNNRTGVRTKRIFTDTLTWDMRDGTIPVVTEKFTALNAVKGELLWFLSGSTDIRDLRKFTGLSDTDFCIWQKNLDQYNLRQLNAGMDITGEEAHDLGYIYGAMWRYKPSVNLETGNIYYFDQIDWLIEQIKLCKVNPTLETSRRLKVESWDPALHSQSESTLFALPPCHTGFQCSLDGDELSLVWNQRSVDTFLGLPFNISSYAILLLLLCKLTGTKPGYLSYFGADVHLYEDHLPQTIKMIDRKTHPSPTVVLPEIDSLDDFTLGKFTSKDIVIVNYTHEPALHGNMS